MIRYPERHQDQEQFCHRLEEMTALLVTPIKQTTDRGKVEVERKRRRYGRLLYIDFVLVVDRLLCT